MDKWILIPNPFISMVIAMLQRLFDAGYRTEKEIVNMTMDEILALRGVNVADLYIISELQKSINSGIFSFREEKMLKVTGRMDSKR